MSRACAHAEIVAVDKAIVWGDSVPSPCNDLEHLSIPWVSSMSMAEVWVRSYELQFPHLSSLWKYVGQPFLLLADIRIVFLQKVPVGLSMLPADLAYFSAVAVTSLVCLSDPLKTLQRLQE